MLRTYKSFLTFIMAEHCNYPSCRNKKLGGHVKGSSDFKIGGIKRVSVLGTRDSVADKLDVYLFSFYLTFHIV